MPGIAELRLPDLYREGHDAPPLPGMTASLEPYQVREMEAAVRDAMRLGRVKLDHGKEELRLLGLCREALGEGATSVPVAIHKEPWPVRSKRTSTKEKSRQKKARRANRRKKKRKR